MKTSLFFSNTKVLLASIGLTSASIFTFALFIIFNSVAVHAETQIEEISNEANAVKNIHDIGQASLLFKQDDQYREAAQLRTDVAMKVTGMINRVSVQQRFSNTMDSWQEGIYVFPLPENAAVDHMRLKIGDRIIEGQIKEKQEAKKIFAAHFRQANLGSLQARHGFDIGAGAQLTCQLIGP